MRSKKAVVQMPQPSPSPILNINGQEWKNRVLIGHPMTGLVRVEWMLSRFGQTIPCNWSHLDIIQFMSPYVPLQYQVADAENLIAKAVVESDAEWLLFWEHDNIAPTDSLVKLNEYMIDAKIPVIGGLYFTKSVPPEPLVYRDTGNGYYANWKLGDKVWVNGLPFGFTLIHGSIIKAMWKESPEYLVNNQLTRRIFDSPRQSWIDPVKGSYFSSGGTSDLAWCKRVVKERFFEKAGWPKYQTMKYPFLIDTGIFLRHVDQAGQQFPLEIPTKFLPISGGKQK